MSTISVLGTGWFHLLVALVFLVSFDCYSSSVPANKLELFCTIFFFFSIKKFTLSSPKKKKF